MSLVVWVTGSRLSVDSVWTRSVQDKGRGHWQGDDPDPVPREPVLKAGAIVGGVEAAACYKDRLVPDGGRWDGPRGVHSQ